MSTFKGVVEEFPEIRSTYFGPSWEKYAFPRIQYWHAPVDFFRPRNDYPPPLACFLSHVHSDHLTGLESLKAPFVYCSAATKEILTRLERYPHRMNFAKGILEGRKVTYRNLKSLLVWSPLLAWACVVLTSVETYSARDSYGHRVETGKGDPGYTLWC